MSRRRVSRWHPRPLATVTLALVVATAKLVAQPLGSPSMVDRMLDYAATYMQRLSTVVAEEHYDQWVELPPARGATNPRRVEFRSLVSDYALTETDGEWVGYRDVVDVDGTAVRDRDDRLARLLSSGSRAQLPALLADSARFNVRNDRVSRNVNVPTFAIQLLQPRYRSSFTLEKPAAELVDGHRLWRVAFRERRRPTIVKRQGNQDQPMRGDVWFDDETGAIWRTRLTWEKAPLGEIVVSYGRVPDIEALVPVAMSETYRDGDTVIRGEAAYSNVRRFTTAGRVLP